MNVVLSILLGAASYFILMFLCTNLVGMVVRGFFEDKNLEKLKQNKETPQFIKKEIKKSNIADSIITLLFALINVAFLYVLFAFINIWAVVAALLLMVSRIPDLLWEIRNGKKITKENMPKSPLYIITSIMDWVALPAICYAIYILIK